MRRFLAAVLLLVAAVPALGQAVSSVGTITSNQVSLFTDNKHIKGAVLGTGFSYDGTTLTSGVGTNASIIGVNGTQVNGPNFTNTSTLLWSNAGTNVTGFPTNIADAQVAAAAAIARSKIANGTASQIVINDGAGALTSEATLGAARFPALTGDVTTLGGSLASTIAANAVTDAKIRQGAGYTVIGKATTGTGNVADIGPAGNDTVLSKLGAGNIAWQKVNTNQISSANATAGQVIGFDGSVVGWTNVVGGSGTSVYVGSTNVTNPSFNGTTPTAPANALNVGWQTASTNVSAYILGDGNAAHFLNGTGAFSTPAGGGNVNLTDFNTGQFLTNGSPAIAIKTGSTITNLSLIGSNKFTSLLGTFNQIPNTGTNLFIYPTNSHEYFTATNNWAFTFSNWTDNTGPKRMYITQDGTGTWLPAWETNVFFLNSVAKDQKTPPQWNTNAGSLSVIDAYRLGATNWIRGPYSQDSTNINTIANLAPGSNGQVIGWTNGIPGTITVAGGGTSVYVGSTNVTNPSFNGTTPTAPGSGINVVWQTSTTNVSAAIVGDGNAAHFLNGTGVFSTPAGGGSVNLTDFNTTQFITNGSPAIAVKSGALVTNLVSGGTTLSLITTNAGPSIYQMASQSTNLDWSSTAKPIQGITTNVSFTNTFSGLPAIIGQEAFYSVSNSAASNITMTFATSASTNYSISAGAAAASETIQAGSVTTFDFAWDGNKFMYTKNEKAAAAGGSGTVTNFSMGGTQFQVTAPTTFPAVVMTNFTGTTNGPIVLQSNATVNGLTLSGSTTNSAATASTFAGYDSAKVLGSASLPSSALATALTDEDGTGTVVFSSGALITNATAVTSIKINYVSGATMASYLGDTTLTNAAMGNTMSFSGNTLNVASGITLTNETLIGATLSGSTTNSAATASTFAGYDSAKVLGSASLASSALATALTDEDGTGTVVFSSGANLTNIVVTGQTNTDLTASTFVVADATKKLSSTATSANLRSTLSDEVGTGPAMFTRGGRDMSFDVPMGAWLTNGIASLAIPTSFTNASDSLAFADAVTNTARIQFSMPLQWDAGTVQFKFAMAGILTNTTTSTNVVFGIKGASVGSGGTWDSLTFGTQITFTNHIHRSPFAGVECVTPNITVGNTPAVNKPIVWELTRLTSDATDVNTNTIYVISAQIFYTESTTEATRPAATN